MNCSKQAERAGPLFKKSVTIEDIKMLIKILNQKLDVAIKAEFSFSNGDYTNVNTEEMLETKSDSYERVKKSKMSADAAEFVPMSHKIGFSCNGEISRSADLMKQLANSYTDRESLENVSYAFTNENNSAGMKLQSEDSREENQTVKDEQKDTEETPNLSEENHFANTDLEAKDYEDSCDVGAQPKVEEPEIEIERSLKIASENIFESVDVVDDETLNNKGEKCSQEEICYPDKNESENLNLSDDCQDKNENLNSCNEYLDKNEINSEEDNLQMEHQYAMEDFMSVDREQIFNLDNKNFSALNKNSEENIDLIHEYSMDECEANPEEERFEMSFNVEENDQESGEDMRNHFHDNILEEKHENRQMEPVVDMMIEELSEDVSQKLDKIDEEKKLSSEDKGESEDEEKRENREEFAQAITSDPVEKEDSAEEKTKSQENTTMDESVKDKLQAQIIEAIRCEMSSNEMSLCELFEETTEKSTQEFPEEDNNNLSNDSIELDIVPETIKGQWNSHLTNRMIAYSLHLKCTELANIYKAWSESNPPILPTKFWSMKKQNSYTMQSIAENISLVCLKCEVVQMKLEAEQQKLKYEEIDRKMQLSFQVESKNSALQKLLEEAWKKATKTEEMLSHKIWAKRKNWFNIFALFYQKPDVIVPRPKMLQRTRRPFFPTNSERSRLFFRRAWRR